MRARRVAAVRCAAGARRRTGLTSRRAAHHHRAPRQRTRWRDELARGRRHPRSEEHTSELQSQSNLVCRLLLEKKKKKIQIYVIVSTDTNRDLNESDLLVRYGL